MLLCALIWAVLVGAGIGRLWEYSLAPGAPGHPPESWPVASRIKPPAGRPVLVMLAHPQCPCTRASIGELSRLVAQAPVSMAAYVLFISPHGFKEDWVKSDLWRSAAAIPGVTVVRDYDAREAELFGASTSGQTMLYDDHGRLRFTGGITAARGHSGDNAGRSSILSLLAHSASGRANTPVFGCELFSPEAKCKGGAKLRNRS